MYLDDLASKSMTISSKRVDTHLDLIAIHGQAVL